MYSECREGRKVKSLACIGGEAGTGKGKMLWVELGRRWKNLLDRCRKVSGASAGLDWLVAGQGFAHRAPGGLIHTVGPPHSFTGSQVH